MEIPSAEILLRSPIVCCLTVSIFRNAKVFNRLGDENDNADEILRKKSQKRATKSWYCVLKGECGVKIRVSYKINIAHDEII